MYCTDKFPLMRVLLLFLLLLPSDLHQLSTYLRNRQLCVVFIFPAFLFWRNRLISPPPSERHTDPSQQILWFWNLPEMSDDSLSGQNCLNWGRGTQSIPEMLQLHYWAPNCCAGSSVLANFLILRYICRPNSKYIMKFRAKRCLILLTVLVYMWQSSDVDLN